MPIAKPESYRRKAEEVTAFIQTNLWDADAKRYHPAVPRDPKALPYDFMWANGVQFSALVGALRYDRRKYRPIVDAFFEGLNRYWDSRAAIPGYDAYFSNPGSSDKYYDDNAWMVLTFTEAYARTKEKRFLDRAEETLKFVLSGWDDRLGGGIYWHQAKKSKNTCSNGPSATAALAVAAYRNRDDYMDQAKRIVAWTNKNLQAPTGTFWDNVSLENKIERTQWTYNTGLMLRANLDLYRFTKDRRYREEAQRLGQASEKEFVNPRTGAFRDEANFSHLLAEAFLDLYRETKEPYLLRRVQQCATFVYKYVRDPKDGGYWTKWEIIPNRNEERKTLMTNASVARLFWLLADYPDPEASGEVS